MDQVTDAVLPIVQCPGAGDGKFGELCGGEPFNVRADAGVEDLIDPFEILQCFDGHPVQGDLPGRIIDIS